MREERDELPALCQTAIVVPNEDGRSRSDGGRTCCAPSTKPCAAASRARGSPCRHSLLIRNTMAVMHGKDGL